MGKVKLPNDICGELDNTLGLLPVIHDVMKSDMLVKSLGNSVVRAWANQEDNITKLARAIGGGYEPELPAEEYIKQCYDNGGGLGSEEIHAYRQGVKMVLSSLNKKIEGINK